MRREVPYHQSCPQPPSRGPLGPGGTETESDCPEGDQKGERQRGVPAWAPLPGKKLGAGWGPATALRPIQVMPPLLA